MVPTRKLELDNNLDVYFATLRSPSLRDALKRGAGNWRIYAAVTGSAMAMVTNASAGVIYTGPENVTATVSSHAASTAFKTIVLKSANGPGHNQTFRIGVEQNAAPGKAFLTNDVDLVGFLLKSTGGPVEKLSFGAPISAAGKFDNSNGVLGAGWTPNVKGYAGFSFLNTSTSTKDYGWIQLKYTDGTDGDPNSITAFGWAFDNTGATITAGEGIPVSTTPEPSTAALALLAAGAAGVEALRRRRKSAV